MSTTSYCPLCSARLPLAPLTRNDACPCRRRSRQQEVIVVGRSFQTGATATAPHVDISPLSDIQQQAVQAATYRAKGRSWNLVARCIGSRVDTAAAKSAAAAGVTASTRSRTQEQGPWMWCTSSDEWKWVCAICGNKNFKSRIQCNWQPEGTKTKCAGSKPAAGETAASSAANSLQPGASGTEVKIDTYKIEVGKYHWSTATLPVLWLRAMALEPCDPTQEARALLAF